MNWQQMEGNWKEFKGHVRQKWGELTDDELDEIAGRRQVLVGKLQQRYGKTQEAVEQEVDEWFEELEERATFNA